MIEGITGEKITGLDDYASARVLVRVDAFEAELRERRRPMSDTTLVANWQMDVPVTT